jgi:transcriptional regulator with XRE-family HTH domain
MGNPHPAKVVRQVRKRLQVSQEGLARLLNATKGAVQHWERGRNNPDLARLNALRQLCPPGPERKGLDALVKLTQTRVSPLSPPKSVQPAKGAVGVQGGRGSAPSYPSGSLVLLRRENQRLQRQVAKLEATVRRREERLRTLEDLAAELQREVTGLRSAATTRAEKTPSPAGHS